jgi:hypothetical protein
MIADLADLGGLDAARVVAFVTPLRRLVAAATFLIFRGGWRGSRGRFVGGEKEDGRSKQESQMSHTIHSCKTTGDDKRKQKSRPHFRTHAARSRRRMTQTALNGTKRLFYIIYLGF